MSSIKSALEDWCRSMRLPGLWFNLALEDLRDRYRRTAFGLAWIVLSFILFVAVKILVFGQLSNTSPLEFGLFVTIGFGAWSYISAAILEGCSAYIHSRAWILGSPIPYPVFLLQAALRNWLVFSLTLVVMLVALAWRPAPFTTTMLLAIPGLAVYVLTSLWLAAILAPMCARYRDVYHAVQTGLRLVFFITPVLWMPRSSPVLAKIASYNPISSYIDLVREPLLYDRLPTQSWQVVLVINGVGLILACWVYVITRKRIAFWV